jgi:hypothetical protein
MLLPYKSINWKRNKKEFKLKIIIASYQNFTNTVKAQTILLETKPVKCQK